MQLGIKGHQIEDNSVSLTKLITTGYTPTNNSDLATVQYVLQSTSGFTTGTTVNFIGGNGISVSGNVISYTGVTSSATSAITTSQITVNLGPGGTSGSYSTGDIIPVGTLLETISKNMLQKRVLPTYTPATIGLSNSGTLIGEIGETLSPTLITNFSQNDAGALSIIRTFKNSVLIGSGTTSPFSQPDTIIRINGNISYQSNADYLAGIIKNDNLGTPDSRPAQVRNPNAPQASENGFSSNTINFSGYYYYFYDSVTSTPTTSAQIRALNNKQLTVYGNTFTLNTGTVNKTFTIAMPNTHTLSNVTDVDALGANITGSFTLSTFNVNDANGNPVAYNIYTLANAVAFPANHRFSITIA